VTDSAQTSPDIGILTDGESQITWSGTVTESVALLLTFQVQIETSSSMNVENVAQLQLADIADAYYLKAPAVLINVYHCYLPIIMKQH
jgi:hypothetical protein